MAAVTMRSILLHSHYSSLFSGMRRVTLRLSKRTENLMYRSGGQMPCTTAKKTGKREQEGCNFKKLFHPRPQIHEGKSVSLKAKLFAASSSSHKGFFCLTVFQHCTLGLFLEMLLSLYPNAELLFITENACLKTYHFKQKYRST